LRLLYRGRKVAQTVSSLELAVLDENCAPTSICPAMQWCFSSL
jgi:hypothetical protein